MWLQREDKSEPMLVPPKEPGDKEEKSFTEISSHYGEPDVPVDRSSSHQTAKMIYSNCMPGHLVSIFVH